jgi:hypothetical protein
MTPGRFLTTDFTDYTDFFCEETHRLASSCEAVHLWNLYKFMVCYFRLFR